MQRDTGKRFSGIMHFPPAPLAVADIAAAGEGGHGDERRRTGLGLMHARRPGYASRPCGRWLPAAGFHSLFHATSNAVLAQEHDGSFRIFRHPRSRNGPPLADPVRCYAGF